jgi:hypothetical protein
MFGRWQNPMSDGFSSHVITMKGDGTDRVTGLSVLKSYNAFAQTDRVYWAIALLKANDETLLPSRL